jgi:hypothetical protein
MGEESCGPLLGGSLTRSQSRTRGDGGAESCAARGGEIKDSKHNASAGPDKLTSGVRGLG